ncbi:MAG: DUF2341 domain-containing protein [Candidatus Kariarchaeaceae archaeon]|jgi:hypothetical protein
MRPWGQHNEMEIRVISGNVWEIDWGANSDLQTSSFVAVTWNEGTDELLFYKGDESTLPTLDASNTVWTKNLSLVTATDNVFLSAKGSSYVVDGHGDDFRYYNTDRSLSEIQNDYNIELTGSESNLVNYYKLNNDFTDSSGIDDGSGVGSTSFSTDVPFTTSGSQIWPQKDFKYKKGITIDNTKVGGSSPLTDFPVLIDLIDSDLRTKVQSDGDDIIFTDESGTKLDHELETFNQTYNNTHAQLVAWVRVPSLSATVDTEISIYYGNSTIGSQENPTGVWNNNYNAVWHLNQNVLDSTTNNNDGTNFGSTDVIGKIANGQNFDGVDDYIDGGSGSSLDNIFTSGGAISAWIYPTGWGENNYGRILDKSTSTGGSNGWGFYVDNDGGSTTRTVIFQRGFTTARGVWGAITDSIGLNQWQYVVLVFDASSATNDPIIYINGSSQTINEIEAPSGVASDDSAQSLRIGNFDITRTFDGKMDDIRIHSTLRSADWVFTEYENQKNPSNFYTIGIEVPKWFSEDFSFRKIITVDKTKVSGSSPLLNFPMLIDLVDSDLQTKVQADADDIIFTDDSGTKLDHEIETFNQTYNNTHAQLITWVRIPDLSATVNTNIVMYYGNSTMGAKENPSGVWGGTYKQVWHLGETSGGHYDSAKGLYHGEIHGTVTQDANGKINGADEFHGLSSESYIEMNASDDLVGNSSFTVGAWINLDVLQSSWIGLIQLGRDVEPDWLGLWLSASNNLVFGWDWRSGSNIGSTTLSADQWYYAVAVFNGTHSELYLDGSPNAGPSNGYYNTISNLNWTIGTDYNGNYFNGTIDEVRISGAARSADWIATEYNNQFDPINFFSVGIEEAQTFWPQPDFQSRKLLTIDNTLVSGSTPLTDFPVLIDLIDSDLRTKVQADGDDIIFTDIFGTKLDHEIETFNQTYNTTHAQLITWVRIPSLSAVVDTPIFMYYGNTTMVAQQNPANVWDSKYRGVWHLGESSGMAKDSTSYGTDGILSGGVIQGVSGQLGGAYDFDGVDGEVSMGDPGDGHLDGGTGNLTISLWVNFDSTTGPAADQLILTKGATASSDPGYQFQEWNSGLDVDMSDGTDRGSTSEASVSTGSWSYIVGVLDRTTDRLSLYVNGSFFNYVDVSVVDSIDSSNNLVISRADKSVNGTIDEVRIAPFALTSDWIATEYNNQWNSASFFSIGGQEIQPWSLNDFQYKKIITIDNTKVSGSNPLIDFPVAINLYDSDLRTKTQSDGDDIIFTDSSQMKLDHEIEIFNQTYNSTHAQLVAWVRIPSLSATVDTNITMYYGNTATGNLENSTGVWTSSYGGVWHLNDDPSGTVYDSTSNNHDGTANGNMDSDDLVPGKISNGLDFDGIDDFIPVGQIDTDSWTAITVEAWIYRYDTGDDRILCKSPNTTTTSHVWCLQVRDSSIRARLATDGFNSSFLSTPTAGAGTVNPDSWYHVAFTWDSTTETLTLFVNGVETSSYYLDGDGILDSSLEVVIANVNTTVSGGRLLNGSLDEIKLSSIARSSDWLATEYNNQFDPLNFYTVGIEEITSLSWSPDDFQSKKVITIDNTKVSGSSDLTNFPILINLYDTDLHDDVQSDGDDIIFVDAIGTKLDHEIELFNQTYNGTHAHLISWVRIPSLSPTINTNITMYYGNSTMSKQESSQGVWETGYVGVWHLNDLSTSTILDSTLNNNGTKGASNQPLEVVAKIGQGQSFTPLTEYIQVGTAGFSTSSGTIELWAQAFSFSGVEANYLFGHTTQPTWNDRIQIYTDDVNGNLDLGLGDSHTTHTNIQDLATDTWYHVVLTWDGTNYEIFVDGVSKANGTYTGFSSSYSSVDIGNTGSSFDRVESWNGIIDEVRVSNITRSSDWFLTQYNNQFNPSNFYSIGPEMSISGGGPEPPSPGEITIYDSAWGFTAGGNSISFDLDSSGSDLLAIAILTFNNDNYETISTMTFNGDSFTNLGTSEQVDDAHASIWYLKNPDTGTGLNFNLVFSQNLLWQGSVWVGILTGVNQTDTFGTLATYANPTTNSVQLGVSTNDGDLVLGGIAGETTGQWSVAGPSQELYYYDGATTNTEAAYGNATSASYTFDWTASSADHVAAIGVAIHPIDVIDTTPPTLNNFGLDDPGTGTGTFWADVTDDTTLNNVTLQVNSTSYQLVYNGSLWIYQLDVSFGDYYTYQIINASDTSGNFLSSPSLINNHTFNIDNTAPSVIDWIYDETLGIYGTFRANITDSWGIIDTVYVNVTSCDCISLNIAIMQFNGTEYVNDTILMNPGTIFFKIIVNDTYNNVFITGLHSGDVANNLPTVGNLTLTPAVVRTNDTLTLSYDYFDIDSHVESGTEIRWYKNDILQPSYNDATIILSSALFKGDQWYATVKPNDGYNFGSMVNSSIKTISNTIPEVSNVQINPSNPINTSALTVSYTYFDLDADLENTGNREIRWYRNGVLLITYNNLLTLPNTATIKGETWKFGISIHDGTDYSNWVNSSTVIIANSAPTASNVKILNSLPKTTDDLVADWTYDDIDLDPEDPNWLIYWYKNDILQIGLNNSKTVISGNTTKTDIWYFKLQVYDGTNYSIVYQSSSVQILNTAPTASNINITQNPTTFDQLVASWTFNDADGDSQSAIVNITWYKDGIHQVSFDNSSTVDSSATAKSQTWYYLLQVYDGEDFSLTYNSSNSGAFTTILNIAPTASNLGITSTPKTFDDLVATWDYADDDGDIESTGWIIHWYKDNILQATYDNLTTVSFSATTKGEVWNYTLQVYDGEDYSIMYSSSSTTIINSIPTASGLSLPANLTTTDDLVASWTYNDADSDPEDSSWILLWYKNDFLEPSLNNTITVLAGNTSKNQGWYFTLQVYDGENYSILYTSSSIQIQNTAPTASNLGITSSPITTDDLSTSWAYNDIDGDTQSGNWLIRWYKDSVLQPSLNDSITVTSGSTSKNENWYYTLQVYDGTDYSILYTSGNVTILNSVPTASNLGLTSTPKTLDDLIASWTFNDIDGDSENTSWIIYWYKDNVLQAAYDNLTTVSSSATTKGEVWNYTLRVFDSQNYSITYNSSSTTVLNSLPTVTNPTFNETSGVTTADSVEIDYLASYFDADGDSNNASMLIVFWFGNGVYNSTKDNHTILYSTDTDDGDFWYYILRVFDGSDYSQNITSLGLGIGSVPNDAPIAGNLTLTATPATTDNLIAFYDYYDNQSHAEAGSEIRWYKNGILQPEFNNTKTVPFTATIKGENWHFTIRPKDGLDYGTLKFSVNTTIVNTIPTASNLGITTSPKTADDLIATWDFTDIDGDSENNNWIIRWYKDGLLQSSYDNLTTVFSSATAKGEIWNYTVQVFDGEDYSILYISSSTTIVNTVPTASGLSLPANPITTDDLIAGWTYNDADTDPEDMNWIILWYKNTVLQPNLNDSSIALAGNTTKNQVWFFTLQVYDGEIYSILYTSPSVQIQNTAPTASNYQVTATPTTSDDLVASWTYSDVDGDIQSSSWLIRWYKNGNLQLNLNDSITVSSLLTSKGENWHFTLRVSDGTDNSVLFTTTNVIILNTVPTASNLGITSTPRTSDDLTASWVYSDIDGDIQSTSWIIHWYKNSVLQFIYDNLTILSSSATSKGEVWNYTIQVYDGDGYSTMYTSPSTIILNSVPTTSNLRLVYPTPLTNDNLVANWTFIDADNDAEDLSWVILWYKSNIIQTNLNNSRIVTSGNTTKNQVWFFELRVSDGTNYSITYKSPNFQILNTAPTASNLGITNSPKTTDNLQASWIFNDADGDSQSVILNITWFKDGVYQSLFDNSSTVDNSATAKSEVWHYFLQVYDGESFSIIYNSSDSGAVTLILNTIPEASNVDITNQNPFTTNDLATNWIFSDDDGDSQSATINITWYKNGVYEPSYTNTTTLTTDATTKGEQWNFILQVYDGEDFSIVYNSSVVSIINSIPSISAIPTFNKTSAIKTIEDVEISYNYQDNDNDTLVLANVIIKWFLYGFEQPSKENQTVLYSSDTVKDQFWSYQIQVYDGEAYSIIYNSILIAIENSAPTIQGFLVITPINPAPSNTLVLSYTWQDDDSGDIERDTEVRWYKNNVLQPAFNDLLAIHGSNIFKDDRWNVTVRPKDGSDFGNIIEFSVVIGNTKPQIITNSISAITVYTTTTLYINTSFSQSLLFYDGDGDSIIWIEYKWFVNNVENATYYNQITIVIQNSQPIVSNVAISPGYTFLYTNNSLDLSWNYSDVDFDPEVVSQMKVIWYLNLIEQTGLANITSIPANLVYKGDSWMVQVQVYDGTSYSTLNQSLIIQISNTAPTASNVGFTGTSPDTTDDLVLIPLINWIFSDDDGDSPSVLVNITWYKDGVHQVAYNNLTSLPSSATTKGDNWYFRLQVFDGEDWSVARNSQVITIINAIPQIESLYFINTEYQQFIVEDEDMEITYLFTDPDSLDSDQSQIIWFVDGTYFSQYNNLTVIPASETVIGQIWSFQIIPSDGFDSGIVIMSENKTIENRPNILSIQAQPVTDTEGHYIIWIEVDVNPVNPLQGSQPNMNLDIIANTTTVFFGPATPVNSTHFTYDWQYDGTTVIGLDVTISIELSSRVRYSAITSIISDYENHSFVLEDYAPPRVKQVDIVFDDDENPNDVTFIVRIEEFGSGIDNATLYYAFVPISDSQDSPPEASILVSTNLLKVKFMQSDLLSEDFQEVSLSQLNNTYYWATVAFNPDSPVLILYQIQVFDKSGNFNPNAYPVGLDESQALRYTLSGGIPLEEVMTYVALIVVVMLIFSFVIIKKFRSKELVGLDIDLVMVQTREINEDALLDSELDEHTLGIVISLFDQQHGPVPLVADPTVLGDNFDQLVELSDLSFSTGRFVEDFEREVSSTFEFDISPQLRVNSITFAFALNRPEARGGAENLTLNILVHEAFYPLVSQFITQLKELAHEIHDLMHEKQESTDLLLWEVRKLRRKVSTIVLAYKEIYETTELIMEEK